MRIGIFAVAITALAACGQVVQPPNDDICTKPGVVCNCKAETEATDCTGAHQGCDVTATGRSCACVAGYTMGPSGCIWAGSIKDPGFAAMASWTAGNGALLNTTAVGGLDPGELSFVASALCGLGYAKQTFDMPTFAKAEPLVLELSYKNQIVSGMFGSEAIPMGVSFGGGWASLPPFSDAMFHTARVCLGESGYAPAGTAGRGAPVTIEVGPYSAPLACPNTMINNFSVDHAAIVIANAGECGAMPGVTANSDAESTGGWTFTTGGSGASSGGFVPGIGDGNSRAARITLNQRCDSASMATTINVPRVANPALDMFAGLSNNNAFGTMSVGALVQGTGQLPLPMPAPGTGNYHVCLPPALAGQTSVLNFSVRNVSSGSCADMLNYQLWADSVKVVDDPTCASDGAITNPGFERTGLVAGGFVNSGFAAPNPDGAVAIRSAAGQAHSGSSYLQIDSFVNCSSQGATLLVTVPPASAAGGPALTFFAKASVNAAATVTAAAGTTKKTIAQGTPYQQYTLCLSPQAVGRPQAVTFSNPVSQIGTCGSANAETLQVDDLAVGNDASCPSM